MKAYFDTGLLVKLYLTEQKSLAAADLIQANGMPICFCALQQTELRNAIYRKSGRGEITEGQLNIALNDVRADLDGGALESPAIDWPAAWSEADRLTAKYAVTTQCRTLDVLHVALALHLGIKILGTTDTRQMALARKAGLKVVGLA